MIFCEKMFNLNRLLILKILIKRKCYLSWDQLKCGLVQEATVFHNKPGFQFSISNGKLQHHVEDLVRRGFVKKEYRSYSSYSGFNEYLITDEGQAVYEKVVSLFKEFF